MGLSIKKKGSPMVGLNMSWSVYGWYLGMPPLMDTFKYGCYMINHHIGRFSIPFSSIYPPLESHYNPTWFWCHFRTLPVAIGIPWTPRIRCLGHVFFGFLLVIIYIYIYICISLSYHIIYLKWYIHIWYVYIYISYMYIYISYMYISYMYISFM